MEVLKENLLKLDSGNTLVQVVDATVNWIYDLGKCAIDDLLAANQGRNNRVAIKPS